MENSRFKFRVWDIKEKRFIDHPQINPLFGCVCGYESSTYPLQIEQCTGLSDKNGNLIYEGDKVEISVYGDVINEGFVETDTQYQGIVVWVKQGFYVQVVDEFFYIPEEPEDVEIIGNIHEQA